MKKVFLITAIFLFSIFSILFIKIGPANAKNIENYDAYCSDITAKKTFGGFMMSTTGANLASRNTIEKIIEHEIKKETNSKFDIKIENFFANNLLGGEFKSLSAKGKNFQNDGIYLSDISLKTFCPYNKITLKDDKVNFDYDFVMTFNSKITQDDLNKMMNDEKYKNIIDELNSNSIINSFIKIQDSQIELKDTRIILKYKISFLEKYLNLFNKNKTKTVNLSTKLNVKNGKISFDDIKSNSKSPESKLLAQLINVVYPDSLKFEVDENSKGKIELKNAKIVNGEIVLDGLLIVFKNI